MSHVERNRRNTMRDSIQQNNGDGRESMGLMHIHYHFDTDIIYC